MLVQTAQHTAAVIAIPVLPLPFALPWFVSPQIRSSELMTLLCMICCQALLDLNPGMVAQSIRDLSSGGQLPLHLAAASGALDVLQLLLAAGADVAAQNGYGETALQVIRPVTCC